MAQTAEILEALPPAQAQLGIAPEPSDDHHLVEAAHTISC